MLALGALQPACVQTATPPVTPGHTATTPLRVVLQSYKLHATCERKGRVLAFYWLYYFKNH